MNQVAAKARTLIRVNKACKVTATSKYPGHWLILLLMGQYICSLATMPDSASQCIVDVNQLQMDLAHWKGIGSRLKTARWLQMP
jgi:hypothetical protein